MPPSRYRACALRHRVLVVALSTVIASPAFANDNDAKDPTELDRIVVTGSQDAGKSSSATGLALSPRETPQSISVVGREQMDDFGLDNVNKVLDATPGVNVERVEAGRTYYTARGFDITNFQRDGLGIALPYGLQNGDVDTSLYERVEVVRGANGLMSSTGNPSATINLVRKRPTVDTRGELRATVGSWNRWRLEGDASGAFGTSGVRGRIVGAYENADSYLDRYAHAKRVAYGVLEADLGERTLLSAGLSYQRNDADSPLWGALPLYYTDGTPTDYDRSTSTAADWTFWDTEETRGFVELAQQFASDWEWKATYNYEKSTEDTQLFYVYGTPDRATGSGLFAYPSDYEGGFTAHQVDVRVAGPLTIGGREHDLVFGVSHSDGRVEETSAYGNDIGTPLPAPLESWNGAYPKPSFDASFDGSDFDYRRDSVYATVRWNLADRFKLITGANRSEVQNSGVGYGEPHDSDETKTSPFIGAVWDVSANASLYASYAEIFAPQWELDIDGRPVGAVEGSNAEVGVKSEWFEGRLGASAAVFRVRQDNLAEAAGFDPVAARTYYRGIDAESKGFEIDVSGRIGEHVSLSGGYTQLDVESPEGDDVRTYVPRKMLRVSAVWDVNATFRVGASGRWQDDIHREQSLVLPNGQPVVTRQEAYAVLGLMAGYRFADGWDAVFNIDNLTDKQYIPSLYWEQGFYAAPRSASLTVGYRF